MILRQAQDERILRHSPNPAQPEPVEGRAQHQGLKP